MLPSTVDRVPQHTADSVNRRIERRTRENVERAADGGPAAISRRLEALDREWDIERALEANAASIILAGSALGTFVDRRFFALPAVVAAFLLQHALQERRALLALCSGPEQDSVRPIEEALSES